MCEGVHTSLEAKIQLEASFPRNCLLWYLRQVIVVVVGYV